MIFEPRTSRFMLPVDNDCWLRTDPANHLSKPLRCENQYARYMLQEYVTASPFSLLLLWFLFVDPKRNFASIAEPSWSLVLHYLYARIAYHIVEYSLYIRRYGLRSNTLTVADIRLVCVYMQSEYNVSKRNIHIMTIMVNIYSTRSGLLVWIVILYSRFYIKPVSLRRTKRAFRWGMLQRTYECASDI